MKALVYTGPEALEIRDVKDLVSSEGEVLVAVDSVGICGSDMHAFLGHDERRPAPLILGHEVAGTIASGTREGERVTVNPLVNCGECRACQSGRENLCPKRQIISMPPREGGFAEKIVIPERNLVFVPQGFSLGKACMAEPIACGWHAVRLGLSALQMAPSEIKTLVIGGGAIGVGAACVLQGKGCQDLTLVEPNALRRTFLKDKLTFAIKHPDDLDDQINFDLIIDGVGFAATREMATKLVRPGGAIMHIGLGSASEGLDIRRMTLQEITFIGTYTYTADDFRATAAAMFAGELGALDWYSTRALEEGADAFAEIRQGTVPAPKIVLTP